MKKFLAVIICIFLLVSTLIGCNKKSDNKVELRNDLLECCGDFWTKENKNTAVQFVTDVENAYRTYRKDHDLEKYATDVSDIIYENMRFTTQVSGAVDTTTSAAALLNVNILNINARNVDIYLILELGGTDAELEAKTNGAVNAVTYAFCAREIAK